MDRRKTKIRRAANRRKQREQKPPPPPHNVDVEPHWLTPAVYERACASCGRKGSVAYRHSDRSTLCEVCVIRLGVVTRESHAWKRAA